MDELMPQNPLENLDKLTKRHLEVLELFCSRMTYKNIAIELIIGESTVKTYMQQIYWILGLRYLEPSDRRQIIQEVICPEISKREIVPLPNNLLNIPLELPPEIEEMVEEDEKAIILQNPNVIDLKPIYKPVPRRRPWGWLILGLILGAVLVYFVFDKLFPTPAEVVYVTSEPGVTTVTEVQEVTREITSTPQPVQPTSTANVILVTATLPPTTDTPEVPLANPPGFTFFDDFEDGPDPAWEVKYGEVGMANGKYLITTPFNEKHTDHLAILSGQIWRNASVTFKLAPFQFIFVNTSADATGALVLRYQADQDSVGVLFYPNWLGIEFGILSPNGEWTPYGGSLVQGDEGEFNLTEGENEIRVDVIGNTYLVYVNGKQVNSATIPGLEVGEIGFWFQSGTFSDDVETYSPRIEEIQIESME